MGHNGKLRDKWASLMVGQAHDLMAEAARLSLRSEDVHQPAVNVNPIAVLGAVLAKSARTAFETGQTEAGGLRLALAGAYHRTVIAPDAEIGAKQRHAGRAGHRARYGTPEQRAERDARLVRAFQFCREQGASMERAYYAVARANGCCDRTVREAVKKNTRT